MPTVQINAFTNPEHAPFYWHGGERAALLVHGFPGTPAEMRSVGHALHAEGWTVQGLLLPGFGADISNLPERTYADWVHAIDHALLELRRRHRTVLLVGNSMGGALALKVAAHRSPEGVILFAPFWRVDSWLDRVYPLAERVMPPIRPFRRLNLNEQRVRASIRQFMPDADLDDPSVQAALRELSIPVNILGEVRRCGRLGYYSAAQVRAPVLIIQGRSDPLVKPRFTKLLAARLPNLAGYVEVAGEHELIRGKTTDWATIIAAIQHFTGQIVPNKDALS